MSVQALPFLLSPVRDAADLRDACAVRAQAYGHHLPGWAERLAQPDALDHLPGTRVLLCRDKHSGEALGTARIQSSRYGRLQIEHSVDLPGEMLGAARAEVTRLAITAGAPAAVKLALMKACYQHCLVDELRWLVIGARLPALVKLYRKLGFVLMAGTEDGVPLAHAGGLAHQVLSLDMASVRSRWEAGGHPWLDFMTGTRHPDIRVDAPLPVAA